MSVPPVQYRVDALMCVTSTVRGMGQSSSSAHKEITRLFRGCLTDRSMEVRKAATEVRTNTACACGVWCVCGGGGEGGQGQ